MRKLFLLSSLLLVIAALVLAAGCIQYQPGTDTTPTPTPTPAETIHPSPQTTAATPVPTTTPKPERTQMPMHQIDGSGTTESWEIWLDKGVSVVTAKNYGSGNFVVWLSKNGKHQDMLFNELNAYEGKTAFAIEEAGYYTFDVIASGTWALIVDGPYEVSLASFNDYRSNGIMFISGSNSMTSAPFTLEKGVAVFNGYYLGSDQIAATLYANGLAAGTLDSDTGPAKTQIVYPVTVAGSYTLNVNTAGDWGFEVTQPLPMNPAPFTSISGTGDEVTPYYAITGDQMLTMSNTGKNPAAVVFYEADGTVAGDVVIPAGVTDFRYLLKNPKAGGTVVCLAAVTADGKWSVSGTHS
ncbi:hypothetical protein [Methanocorpusculum vombati]|uniref:Uncharacterized protein n=1 Tax=Methanocorpusculum vombati TaxID=3002864 RepID=A0ABT4IKN1_9EURY|nr:hypothetical protein [Methanocorpusculum vombati]MCZ9319380.1 hypothetical protein [Methanocorpusculum sp.]MCZ0862299.1 hypothetical protein [Methanocorpusculum vombati]MDE2520678.1 hypothetical protein [Methanocorpusculum sp.]MDE2534441.1 hypothetical protein [Methanocorpusculum sp.]MDE2545233.1 hypothetical protein [Methanocorpusculum sp.]